MNIYDLIPSEEIIEKDYNLIDKEHTELVPTSDIDSATENSILFLYRKIKDNEKYREIELTQTLYCIVCDTDLIIKAQNTPLIRVKNCRKAFAYATSRALGIDYKRLKIIGITGTNGKTTTSTMIYEILKYAGYKCGYIGTGKIEIDGKVITDDFYSMTTPDPSTLYYAIKRMQDENCDYIIMEVSSHSLALEKVSPIEFECGVFTNLTPEHLDFHRCMWEYYTAKATLFERCKTAVINTDDSYGEILYDKLNIPKFSVGVVYPSDATAAKIKEIGLDGLEYFYKERELIYKIALNLPGIYNVYNSLLAAKCAYTLGVKPFLIKKAFSMLCEVDGRMTVINRSPTVIIDYAHTPFAMENALKTVYSAKGSKSKLIVVFGCGGERDKYKRSKMGNSALKYADKVFITEDNSRSEPFESILSDILKETPPTNKITVIKDRECAINTAVQSSNDEDIILLLGKGHERYIKKDGLTFSFSEKDIVLRAVSERKAKDENRAEESAEIK